MLQPQATRSKIGQYLSENFLSKPALCAIAITAPSTKAATAASSSLWPATISSVMPVIATTSGGIGLEGSLKAEKTSLTPTMRPSGK